ncbi:Mitochondrial import receptor subunit TOM40-like [Oopsacas minuta]|uniref:Mitochondrial import receptor subunit TOM40-like n=1 Tax=Oopsacas minuta TaxID=111878 RepID=A0AAV7JMD6_9METZ|nr:Mitochondrial import receptor subunit TOM40-like [Oopsacas minuta]
MGNTKDTLPPPVSPASPPTDPLIPLTPPKPNETNSLPTSGPVHLPEDSPVFPTFGSHPPGVHGEKGEGAVDAFSDTIESINQEFKTYLPNLIEGAKLTLNTPLSQYFQAIHSLHSSSKASLYSYGISYVGRKKYGEMELYPMFYGEMDNATNLKAICVHKPNKALKLRSDIQTQKSEFSVVQLMAEYMGTDFSFCSTLVNPCLYPASGVLALQYLQRVTQNLSLGVEFTYQKESSQQGAGISGFVGYKQPGWQTFAKLSFGSWSLGYLRKVTENINLVGEYEKTPFDDSGVVTMGYSWHIPKVDFKIYSSINSQWTVSSIVEKRLQPLPVSLALSTSLNQKSNQIKLGVGITIG